MELSSLFLPYMQPIWTIWRKGAEPRFDELRIIHSASNPTFSMVAAWIGKIMSGPCWFTHLVLAFCALRP